MYKLFPNTPQGNPSSLIKRIADNAAIPMDEQNIDYQQYLKWVAEGNTPLPADSQPTGENTNEGAA
jgi:hypothetical protein